MHLCIHLPSNSAACRSSSVARGLLLALCTVAPLCLPTAASAQLLSRPLMIRNARILSMSGQELPEGAIICRGDKIAAVGRGIDQPLFAKVIDAAGHTVTPGLIDVWTTLGMTSPARSPNVGLSARDAFDSYALEDLGEALQHGITALYVSSRGTSGIHGRGAVVRLTKNPRGGIGNVLREDAALEINLASSQKPLARIQTLQAIRTKFESAQTYRESLETYEEDLKEYEEKLKKKGEKKNGDKPEKDKASATVSGQKEEPEEKEKPSGKEDGDEAKKDAKKDKDELKKPKRPTRNPEAEVLLLALDRKIPVRIEAHRTADILNAIELTEEFHLDWILVGATEASLVAEQIPEETPVILSTVRNSDAPRAADGLRYRLDNGARLRGHGRRVYVGGGIPEGSATRFLLEQTLLDAAHDAGTQAPLSRITANAAKLLRVEDRLGAVRPGLLADLVIWTGHPLDPESRVSQVIVSGEVVYEAQQEGG